MNRHDVTAAARASAAGPTADHLAAACALSLADRAALVEHLARAADHDPWVVALARAKVALARLHAPADLPHDRVAVGSRVAFALGGRTGETAVLAPWDEAPAPLGRVPLRTRLGIALLGLREGAHVDVPRRDGTLERLSLEAVLYRGGPPSAPAGSAANDNRWREVQP
jgi:regulator of nucleoside diphosphate kinase